MTEKKAVLATVLILFSLFYGFCDFCQSIKCYSEKVVITRKKRWGQNACWEAIDSSGNKVTIRDRHHGKYEIGDTIDFCRCY